MARIVNKTHIPKLKKFGGFATANIIIDSLGEEFKAQAPMPCPISSQRVGKFV